MTDVVKKNPWETGRFFVKYISADGISQTLPVKTQRVFEDKFLARAPEIRAVNNFHRSMCAEMSELWQACGEPMYTRRRYEWDGMDQEPVIDENRKLVIEDHQILTISTAIYRERFEVPKFSPHTFKDEQRIFNYEAN